MPPGRGGARQRAGTRGRLLQGASRRRHVIDTLRLTAEEAWRLVDAREISGSELFAAYRAAIDDRDEELHCYLHVCDDPGGDGLPIALKDVIGTKGIPTTAGSKILESYLPVYDSTVVERLKSHGLRILGKTNLDEFAMGSSTENSAFGPTHNPWDPERVPGGSSGGSAAAVAAGMAPLALGTDTGGSIRQPAGFTGIVGMKPTYGRISRYGLVAFASSLDQIGPMARTVSDAALLLHVLAGRDPKDSTSVDLPVDNYPAALSRGVQGLRIGIAREAFGQGLQREVRAAVQAAATHLGGLGAVLTEVSLPSLPYALPTFYLLATSEASANLARYDGVQYGLRVPTGDLFTMYTRTRRQGFGNEV